MSSLVIYGDTSGAITLAANAVAGTNTITLPAQTGNVTVSGPAFSAYRNGSQSIGSAAWTKIQFNAEEFDTANCFDSSTNYRFTPTVAGYYQFSFCVTCSAFTGSYGLAEIYKNGVEAKKGSNFSPNSGAGLSSSGAALIYMNGSTDYVELYFISSASSTVNGTGVYDTFFQGCFMRPA